MPMTLDPPPMIRACRYGASDEPARPLALSEGQKYAGLKYARG